MKKAFLSLIKLYRFFLSPLFPQSCRFSPTCSEYAHGAITRYGSLRGLWMSCKRIMKCHPFHPGGYDPVK
ncbi:MAG: membrane protein insertion efficiency factor YidD [bacterium]